MGSYSSRLQAAKEFNRSPVALSRLRGKQALIIGGTSGIGQGLAEKMAQGGASVTIVGRNEEAAKAILEKLRQHSSSFSTTGEPDDVNANTNNHVDISGGDANHHLWPPSHRFIKADVVLLKNCKEMVREFEKDAARLDYLIFCQGKITSQGCTPTSEGIDEKLCLNFYSRAFLTELLLPLLKRTSITNTTVTGNKNDQQLKNQPPRVCSVFSAGAHGSYKAFKTDPYLKENYGLKAAADAAGLYNDLWFDYIARRNPEVAFTHIAPGFVESNLFTHADTNALAKGCMRCLAASPLARTVSDCVEFMLRPLLQTPTEWRESYNIINGGAPKGGEEEEGGGVLLVGMDGQPVKHTPLYSVEASEQVYADTKALLDPLL